LHNVDGLLDLPQLTDVSLAATFIPENYLSALSQTKVRKKKPLEHVKWQLTEPTEKKSSSSQTEWRNLSKKSVKDLWEQLRELLKNEAPREGDMDLMICILETLAESKWDESLGFGMRSDDGCVPSLTILNMPIQKLLTLTQPPYDPRLSVLKLLYSIFFQFPIGTAQQSLAFESGFTDQASALKRLEITQHPVSLTFLGQLTQFTNLRQLILTNNQQENILVALPRLPQLTLLDLSHNSIKSLSGLHTGENVKKFDNLEIFVFSHNHLTSGSKPDYNGIIFLLELAKLTSVDLSNNLLNSMPPLGNSSASYIDLRKNQIPVKEIRTVTKVGRDILLDPQQ